MGKGQGWGRGREGKVKEGEEGKERGMDVHFARQLYYPSAAYASDVQLSAHTLSSLVTPGVTQSQ